MIVIILNLMIIGAIVWCFRNRINIAEINTLTSVITVTGILGTFIGIFISLLQFNTRDIEGSVPALLDGMKFAFSTSIVAMITSVSLRIKVMWQENKQKEQSTEESSVGVTADDIHQELRSMGQLLVEQRQEISRHLSGIGNALSGDGDTTLLTQLKVLRLEIQDRMGDLVNEFRNFAKQVTKNNTQALIQALEEVMRDFNAKINEQFGDNFKRLNEAVERILVWQDQYRQQMGELAQAFQLASESVVTSSQALARMTPHYESISVVASNLERVLTTTISQQQDLERHLQAFSQLAESAQSAFPQIEQNLNRLTEGFSDHVKDATNTTTEAIQNQNQQLGSLVINMNQAISLLAERLEEKFSDSSDRMSQQLESYTNNLSDSIESSTQQTQQAIQSQSDRLGTLATTTNEALLRLTDTIETQLQDMFRENSNRVTRQIQLLDNALSTELTQSLQSLGSQLTSLSQQFVSDYTPLTERLRQVVQIAANLETTPNRRSQN